MGRLFGALGAISVAVVTIGLGGALGAGTALAAPPRLGVTIAAPAPGSAVTASAVKVTLRVGAGVTGVEAFIGNRVISSRFHRHGRTWTASVPRGLVGIGSKRLLVAAQTKRGGGGTDAETFFVGRPTSQLLQSTKTTSIGTSQAQVVARTRVATTAILSLNGHAVTDLFALQPVKGHVWRLTSRDGLRSGVNQLTLVVIDRGGGVTRRHLKFSSRMQQLGASSGPVLPVLGEQGLYLGTDLVTGANGSYNTISIDGAPYTTPPLLSSQAAAIFVQLDEKTLAPVASSGGLTPTAGTVTIAVWKNVCPSFAAACNGSRIWIGTTEVADNESGNGCSTGGNCNTALHGWLLPAAGPDPATWTDSDALNMQTRGAQEATTTNTMQVGSQSFTVNLASWAIGGFELLTLDNAGNALAAPSAYSLIGDATADAVVENQLATDLQSAAAQHVTILLQGFGSLPVISVTGPLASAIAAISGNPGVISRFGPKQSPDSNGGEYALISGRYTTPKSWQWFAQEASSERNGFGSMSALLVRDQTQNDYVPMTAGASTAQPLGTASDALLPLIYQAPSSWTTWVPNGTGGLRVPSSAEQAAFTDIAAEMTSNGWVTPSNELCPNPPDPVRGALCNANATQLSTIASEVETELQFDPSKGTAGGYTQTDFKTVQNAISQEFSEASTSRSAIIDYQGIFGTAEINGAVNTMTIGAAIQKNLRTTAGSTGAVFYAFLSALTDMLSVVEPELGFVDALDFGDSMTFASGAFAAMGLFQPNTGPGNQLADNVQVTQATAAANLQNTLQTASDQLQVYGDYLAADPVKLMEGAALLGGTYAMSGKTFENTVTGTEYAANQYLWGTLLAPAYTIWTGPATLGWNPTCPWGGPNPDNAQDPFGNATANDEWTSADGSGQTNWWIGESVGTDIGDQANITLIPATANQLFGTIDTSKVPSQTTNAGAVMPYFGNTYLTKKALPLNPSQSPPITNSGCLPHVF
jgi:hypothetical protein